MIFTQAYLLLLSDRHEKRGCRRTRKCFIDGCEDGDAGLVGLALEFLSHFGSTHELQEVEELPCTLYHLGDVAKCRCGRRGGGGGQGR